MWLPGLLGAIGLASPSSTEVSLDGVYGQLPSGLVGYAGALGPAVAFEGAQATVGVGTRRAKKVPLRVDPGRFVVGRGSSAREYTYAIVHGILRVGVLVPDGPQGWTARVGYDPRMPCEEATGCVAWNGTSQAFVLGHTLRATDRDRERGFAEPGFTRAMGPIGQIPVPDADLTGRWWAEGVPGSRVDADGALHGWVAPTTWFGLPARTIALDTTAPVRSIQTEPAHPPMGHGDVPGRLLWFGTADGRLFVYHQPAACHFPSEPTWAHLERVGPAGTPP
ncbi:MAG: hypothetical protein AAF211_01450 [Myxococcota bacterium]